MKVSQVLTACLALLGVSYLFSVGPLSDSVQAQSSSISWRPALHDAYELYDSAETLHDRAQRFKDIRIMPATEELEHLSSDLYQALKQRACPTDVVALLNASGAALDQVTQLLTLSCQMADDRKAQTEIDNARRYFAATAQHIEVALQPIVARSPARAPISYPAQPGLPPWQTGRPAYVPQQPHYAPQQPAQPYYYAPQGQSGYAPQGYEVHHQQSPQPSLGRTLARVLISQALNH